MHSHLSSQQQPQQPLQQEARLSHHQEDSGVVLPDQNAENVVVRENSPPARYASPIDGRQANTNNRNVEEDECESSYQNQYSINGTSIVKSTPQPGRHDHHLPRFKPPPLSNNEMNLYNSRENVVVMNSPTVSRYSASHLNNQPKHQVHHHHMQQMASSSSFPHQIPPFYSMPSQHSTNPAHVSSSNGMISQHNVPLVAPSAYYQHVRPDMIHTSTDVFNRYRQQNQYESKGNLSAWSGNLAVGVGPHPHHSVLMNVSHHTQAIEHGHGAHMGFDVEGQVAPVHHNDLYWPDNAGRDQLNLSQSQHSHTPTSFKMTSSPFNNDGRLHSKEQIGTSFSRYDPLKLERQESAPHVNMLPHSQYNHSSRQPREQHQHLVPGPIPHHQPQHTQQVHGQPAHEPEQDQAIGDLMHDAAAQEEAVVADNPRGDNDKYQEDGLHRGDEDASRDGDEGLDQEDDEQQRLEGMQGDATDAERDDQQPGSTGSGQLLDQAVAASAKAGDRDQQRFGNSSYRKKAAPIASSNVYQQQDRNVEQEAHLASKEDDFDSPRHASHNYEVQHLRGSMHATAQGLPRSQNFQQQNNLSHQQPQKMRSNFSSQGQHQQEARAAAGPASESAGKQTPQKAEQLRVGADALVKQKSGSDWEPANNMGTNGSALPVINDQRSSGQTDGQNNNQRELTVGTPPTTKQGTTTNREETNTMGGLLQSGEKTSRQTLMHGGVNSVSDDRQNNSDALRASHNRKTTGARDHNAAKQHQNTAAVLPPAKQHASNRASMHQQQPYQQSRHDEGESLQHNQAQEQRFTDLQDGDEDEDMMAIMAHDADPRMIMKHQSRSSLDLPTTAQHALNIHNSSLQKQQEQSIKGAKYSKSLLPSSQGDGSPGRQAARQTSSMGGAAGPHMRGVSRQSTAGYVEPGRPMAMSRTEQRQAPMSHSRSRSTRAHMMQQQRPSSVQQKKQNKKQVEQHQHRHSRDPAAIDQSMASSNQNDQPGPPPPGYHHHQHMTHHPNFNDPAYYGGHPPPHGMMPPMDGHHAAMMHAHHGAPYRGQPMTPHFYSVHGMMPGPHEQPHMQMPPYAYLGHPPHSMGYPGQPGPHMYHHGAPPPPPGHQHRSTSGGGKPDEAGGHKPPPVPYMHGYPYAGGYPYMMLPPYPGHNHPAAYGHHPLFYGHPMQHSPQMSACGNPYCQGCPLDQQGPHHGHGPGLTPGHPESRGSSISKVQEDEQDSQQMQQYGDGGKGSAAHQQSHQTKRKQQYQASSSGGAHAERLRGRQQQPDRSRSGPGAGGSSSQKPHRQLQYHHGPPMHHGPPAAAEMQMMHPHGLHPYQQYHHPQSYFYPYQHHGQREDEEEEEMDEMDEQDSLRSPPNRHSHPQQQTASMMMQNRKHSGRQGRLQSGFHPARSQSEAELQDAHGSMAAAHQRSSRVRKHNQAAQAEQHPHEQQQSMTPSDNRSLSNATSLNNYQQKYAPPLYSNNSNSNRRDQKTNSKFTARMNRTLQQAYDTDQTPQHISSSAKHTSTINRKFQQTGSGQNANDTPILSRMLPPSFSPAPRSHAEVLTSNHKSAVESMLTNQRSAERQHNMQNEEAEPERQFSNASSRRGAQQQQNAYHNQRLVNGRSPAHNAPLDSATLGQSQNKLQHKAHQNVIDQLQQFAQSSLENAALSCSQNNSRVLLPERTPQMKVFSQPSDLRETRCDRAIATFKQKSPQIQTFDQHLQQPLLQHPEHHQQSEMMSIEADFRETPRSLFGRKATSGVNTAAHYSAQQATEQNNMVAQDSACIAGDADTSLQRYQGHETHAKMQHSGAKKESLMHQQHQQLVDGNKNTSNGLQSASFKQLLAATSTSHQRNQLSHQQPGMMKLQEGMTAQHTSQTFSSHQSVEESKLPMEIKNQDSYAPTTSSQAHPITGQSPSSSRGANLGTTIKGSTFLMAMDSQ